MDIVFVILVCIVFSCTCCLCFQTIFSDKNKSEKVIAVATFLAMLALFICTLLGAKESIKYETMQDYFEGKVEIIEQIDTIRTYKFN